MKTSHLARSSYSMKQFASNVDMTQCATSLLTQICTKSWIRVLRQQLFHFLCGYAGIGRQGGLKNRCLSTYEFKSHYPHQSADWSCVMHLQMISRIRTRVSRRMYPSLTNSTNSRSLLVELKIG